MKNKIANTYQGNTLYLKGLLSGMEQSDMLVRTGESNTIGWILGHITLMRGNILNMLNKECFIKESECQFNRGTAKNPNVSVDLQETLNDYCSRGEVIANTVKELDEEAFKMDIGFDLPGGRDLETYLSFLAWHETFHLGQIDLIKAAAGKGGIK